jgi:methionyl-tRNA synthetase
MTNLVMVIYAVAWNLTPFMPETSDKIYGRLGIKPGDPLDKHHFRVKKGGVLFPRLS